MLFDIVLFIMGWIITKMLFNAANAKFETEVEETKKEAAKKIMVEEISGNYYAWYTEPKEEFIVQTKSIEDMGKELKKLSINHDLLVKTTEEIACQLNELKATKN
jgi:hypothetical protein